MTSKIIRCPQDGQDFRTVVLERTDACLTFGDDRVSISGQFNVSLRNSPTWGIQFIIGVWGQAYRKEKRDPEARKDWHRSEIYVQIQDIDRLISALVDLKKAGVPPRGLARP